VIHVIDAVLVPSDVVLPVHLNIWETLGARGFNSLRDALLATRLNNLFDTRDTTFKYTLFAPTDAAFAAFDTAGLTLQEITDTLAFHVLSGEVYSANITNDMVHLDINDKYKRFNIYAGPVYTINGLVNIVLSGVDIVATNGTPFSPLIFLLLLLLMSL